MASIKLNFPEKDVREFMADLVPQLLTARTTSGHELLMVLDEKKDKIVKKNMKSIHDGKKKITKKASTIVIKGKYSEVTLDKSDVDKIKKLI